jgi:Flp pilus assembly pilin Flp
MIKRQPSFTSRRMQNGGAHTEYMIVAMLVVLVLIANDNVVKQLADAIRKAYSSFVYALSVSWF